MRGKRTAKHQDCDAGRIIPAHAGQTRRSAELRVRTSDHPRACGANRFVSDGLKYVPGSSPRMRGKHVLEQLREVAGRIIPAHAGQTPVMRFMVMVIPDHPRACGANCVGMFQLEPLAGSSPRMRGKQSDFMRKLLSAGPSIIGFAQWLQSSYYCSCLQSSAKTPISRGTTPTSLFLGFQNSITLLLLT